MRIKTIQNIRKGIRGINRSFGVFNDDTWRGFGITYDLSQVLFQIDDLPPPVLAKHLAEALGFRKYNVSRLVDKLESMHLIVLQPLPEDTRAKSISLSPKGVGLLKDMNDFANHRARTMLSGLGEAELELIEKAFLLISRNIDSKQD